MQKFTVIAPGAVEALPEGITKTAAEIVAASYEVGCKLRGITEHHTNGDFITAVDRAIDKAELFIHREMDPIEVNEAYQLCRAVVLS